MAPNALAGLPGSLAPEFDLIGPTVDDDIRRAVQRYGAQAVKDAVKRETRAKRGRKPLRDWPEISPILEADARAWLDGKDPLRERTNYSIAAEFAAKNPGQSHPSTHRRLMQKLAQKRELFMLMHAVVIGEEEHPFPDYLRALRSLIKISGFEGWERRLVDAERQILDYTAKHGPPNSELAMREIEKGANAPILQDMLQAHRRVTGGLAGLIGDQKK